jgi:hypothetical protein
MSVQETTWLEAQITVVNTGKTPNVPVANTQVMLSTSESWGEMTEWATTNSSGIATFNLDENYWGDSKVITAEINASSGYKRAIELVEFSGSTGSATLNTRTLSYTLSGTVTDTDGITPFASKQMCIIYYEGTRYRQVDTWTNSLGYYSVDGITGSSVNFRPSSCNSWDGNNYDWTSFTYNNEATTNPVHDFQFTRTGISLTVTDSNGQPAAFLPVQLNDGSQWPQSRTTDQFGVAFFSGLNSGTSYTPSYKRQQHASDPLRFEEKVGSQSYTIGGVNTITSATLQLTKLPGAVETPVVVSGKLVTVNGSPVANGLVSLWASGLNAQVRSGSNGEFSIANLPHGYVSLNINASGFRSAYSDFITSPEKGLNYALGNFQLRSALNGNHTYSGVLRNTRGEPIPDFELTMDPPWGSGQSRKTATTNSSGAFTFEGLTSGWHSIYADGWHDGYEWKYWSVNLTGTTLNASHTLVGREAEDPNASASISGRVLEYLDVNGPGSAIPISDACIGAWPTDGGRSFFTSTDASGNWSISGLVEGKEYNYSLQGACAGDQNTVNRFDFADKYEYPDYNQKLVAATNGGIPGEIFLVEVSRTGSGSVSGRVKDSVDYSNVVGIPVSIWRSRGGISFDPVLTDNRGEYSFGNLPAGDYYVQVGEYSEDPDALYEVAWFSIEVGSEANRVNAILTRLLSAEASGQVSGQVYDEFGMGHGSAYVHIIGTDNYSHFGYAVTDNYGNFEINGLPVGVSLQMQINPSWNELASFFSEIMIPAESNSVELDPVNLVESATISGAVKGLPHGDSGSGVYVFAELVDKTTKRVIKTTWVDSGSGQYGFEQVPQGTFLIRYSQNPAEYMGYSDFVGPGNGVASVKPVYWNRTEFGTSDHFAASELEIEPGDTRRGINVSISLGASISGDVSVATSDAVRPLSGTRQVVVIAHMKQSNGTWIPVTRSTASGSNNSKFSVIGLAGGRYKLEFQDFRRGNNSLVTSYNGGSSSFEAAPEIVLVEGEQGIANHSMTIAPPEKSAEAFDLDDLGAEVLAQLKDEIVLGANAEPGSDLKIFVGTEFSGEFVSTFANSTPVLLGDWEQVDSRGYITVTIPATLPEGSHRIAVQDSGSTVFGWAPIRIEGPEATAPGAPVGLVVSNLAGRGLTLSWQPPSSNGGADITDYKIEFSSNNGGTWSAISREVSSALSFNVTGLLPLKSYQFKVSAINAQGVGPASSVVSATTVAAAPSAPRSVKATSISSSGAALSWKKPNVTGGARVTNYKVETSRDNGNSWQVVRKKVSTSTKLTLSGLFAGTTYIVRVSAKNSAGFGTTAQVRFKTRAGAPSAPTNLRSSSVTGTKAVITWDLPASNGGKAIKNYRVEISRNCSTYTVLRRTASNSLVQTVTKLKPRTQYCFRVSTITSLGTSKASKVLKIKTKARN